MSDLKTQEKLTDGKGWKQVLKEANKEVLTKYKTKAKNIWGGMKVVASKIKGDNQDETKRSKI